mgnify:FL=1
MLSFNSFFGSQLAFVTWYCLRKQDEAPPRLLRKFNDEVISLNISLFTVKPPKVKTAHPCYRIM